MKSLSDSGVRDEIQRRLGQLGPHDPPIWGRFNAHEMVCHAKDQLLVALGDVPVTMRTPAVVRPLLRFLVVYLLPRPPRARIETAPEMLLSKPSEWNGDVLALRQEIDRFATATPMGEHPAFGRLSPRQWGILAYKHLDHHLRQFGR